MPSLMSSGIAFLHPSLWASIPEARDRAMKLKKREDRILKRFNEERRELSATISRRVVLKCVEEGAHTSEVGAGFKSLCLS